MNWDCRRWSDAARAETQLAASGHGPDQVIFAIEAGAADQACRVDIHGRCGSSPWDRDLIVQFRHVTAFRAHKAQSRPCPGRGVVGDPTSEPFRHSAVTAHRRGKDLYLAHTVPLKSGDMIHETNLSNRNSATGERLLVASSPVGVTIASAIRSAVTPLLSRSPDVQL